MEHVQILSYVHFFLSAFEKTATNLESSLLGLKDSTKAQSLLKQLDVLLSNHQMQLSCLGSIEKALESVTDNSIASACNLELARRDSVLKALAQNLHKHDFNRLQRTVFKSSDLFWAAMINEIEKKHQKSPKSPRTKSKPTLKSKRYSDDSCYSKQQNFYGQRTFRDQSESRYRKSSYHSSQTTRRGRNRRRWLHQFKAPWRPYAIILAGMGKTLLSPRSCAILRWGYRIIPQSKIPISVLPTIHSGYARPENHVFLRDCMSQMLK